MNKNTLYNNIIPSGGTTEPILPRWFFFYIRSTQPQSSDSDLIENKPTRGGSRESMIQIPLLFSYPVYAMLSTATYDLTQLLSNAVKLISSSVNNTFEMNVKGLIELMYQF